MRFVLLYTFLLLRVTVVAQHSFTRDIALNETLSPVRVNACLQDQNGYMWLGTDDGVYRFNGRTFTLIPDSIHKPVTAMACRGNTVFAGYSNGSFAYVYDNRMLRIKIQGEAPATTITDIIPDVGGLLWLSTEGQGIIMVMNNIGISYNKYKGLSDDYVYNLFVFPNKRIVATTDQGIDEVYLNNGKIAINKFTTANGLPDNIVRVIRPMQDASPCWLGTQDGGVAFYCRASRVIWTPYVKGGWVWGAVNDILPMTEGKAWVATENGYLLEVNTKDGDTITVKPHFFHGKKIKKLLVGRSGILWCATNVGLTMLTDEYMQYIPIEAPYNITDVRAMTVDKANDLWYSLDNKLYRHKLSDTGGPEFVYEAPANITSLFADNRSRLWIGSFGKGLFCRYADGTISKVSEVPSLINESVLDVSGTANRLWVSGLNGVEELNCPDGKAKVKLVQLHNKNSGIGSDYVYQVYPDRKGNIWMATDGGGVCTYSNGGYKTWTQTSGLDAKVVYNVTEDAKGNIWAATLNHGLYKFNGRQWQRMSLKDGLQDINISTVAANATGQVAIVHAKGFDVWYPGSGQFRNYQGNRQGFNIDTLSTVLKLAANDTAGNLYIPFQRGMLVLKNIYAPYDIKPDIFIQSVSVFFNPIETGTNKFKHNENQLSFKYEGINFANADKLHYRYKLEGFNNTWIETSDDVVTFPQLQPRKYTFRVQVSHNSSFAGASEASYSFVIETPFWKRWWFIALFGLFVFSIVYIYIRIREQNLRKLSSLQSERMLFEYEHLKSQVNPHFLFNSLNTLASLIEEDKRLATDYTTHLADFYRNMLAYRNKDLVPLSEEWTILQNYVYIQQSRFGDALRLEIDIPGELMHTKRIVPLSLQLLVENAIKHNVVSKASPLTIAITATVDKITVKNNLNLKISKEKGSGLGLVNIKKRYSLLTDKNIYIGVSDTEYTVILPLL